MNNENVKLSEVDSDEVERQRLRDKAKTYYYKNKEKVNARHLMKYYTKKAEDADIDITGLSLNEVRFRFLEYKMNKK